MLAQLEMRYEDGSVERVVTDERWRASTGAVLASDLYDGETYDARLEQLAWGTPDFDDRHWTAVRPLEHDLGTLVAPDGPPVRRTETLSPVALHTSPSGRTLVDFGQNLVGWVRLRVRGEAGQTVTLRHAEVLEHDELGVQSVAERRLATDHVTSSKAAVTTCSSRRQTFHGFRYVEVDGLPGRARRRTTLEAVVIHSDMARIGAPSSARTRLLNQAAPERRLWSHAR